MHPTRWPPSSRSSQSISARIIRMPNFIESLFDFASNTNGLSVGGAGLSSFEVGFGFGAGA